MPAPTFTCEQCDTVFSIPESVLAKYPNWTPRSCVQCRKAGGRGPRAGGGKGAGGSDRPPSGTQSANLPTAQILMRFTAGPDTGVFTDGSCQGNPGPGGWGAVRVRDGRVVAQRYGSEARTTNNRMELTAMIAGLEMIGPDDDVAVYSDSSLVVNTLTQWAKGWEARGWKRKEGDVKNLDLVQRAWALAQERPRARLLWIRAHDGSRWNEYADALSTAHLRDEV